MKLFYLTGMFRAGSTLLSRIIDNHEEAYCNSDIFFYALKSIRNHHAKKINYKVHKEKPLEDYIFSKKQIQLFNNIINEKKLSNIILNKKTFNKKQTLVRAKLYEKNLLNFLRNFKLTNVDEFFKKIFSYIKEKNKKKLKLIGIKANWGNEFAYSILNNYRNSKVIILMRDPRSIAASKLSRKKTYPLLFFIRQWRKLSCISIDLINKNNLNKRVKIVKYEDLITKPKKTIKDISNFLSLSFDNKILNLNNIKDGNQKIWKQNTSYKVKRFKFVKQNISSWKKVLNADQVKLIESLCASEMKYFNYKLTKNKSIFMSGYKHFIYDKRNKFDKSLLKFLKVKDVIFDNKNYLLEKKRWQLLNCNMKTKKNLIKNFFLFNDTYKELKKNAVKI